MGGALTYRQLHLYATARIAAASSRAAFHVPADDELCACTWALPCREATMLTEEIAHYEDRLAAARLREQGRLSPPPAASAPVEFFMLGTRRTVAG